MLFQPSNISPSTLSGIGSGVVDALQGVTVSWQVNGDTPMTAYQITIYQNDSASTQKYTTGKITLSTPFQTHDRNGNPQFFSTKISAANLSSAGIVNGYANGYKIIIKQWWSANDYVEQTSASVFLTMATPSLTIDTISANKISETITATYTQAQNDPISTVEWIFAVAGSESTPIKQTGTVTTQILAFDADGLMDGVTYSIECNVVTASGVYISTGFITFLVSYSLTAETLTYTLGQLKNSNGIYLSWDSMSASPITGYEVYRRESGVSYLKHVATMAGSNIRELVDYSVGSQAEAQYVVFAMNGSTALSAGQTRVITPRFWSYSILLCYVGEDGNYHVNGEFLFGLGIETGSVSNNNEPTLQVNFTPYPNRQPISTNYKTGQLKGYIGKANNGQYYDSLTLQEAIYAISLSRMTKFYKNRKGDVLMVETSSSISMETGDNSPQQPLYATINWVEVGSSENISIVSEPGDAFWPIPSSN
jgi:hypothetical protein